MITRRAAAAVWAIMCDRMDTRRPPLGRTLSPAGWSPARPPARPLARSERALWHAAHTTRRLGLYGQAFTPRSAVKPRCSPPTDRPACQPADHRPLRSSLSARPSALQSCCGRSPVYSTVSDYRRSGSPGSSRAVRPATAAVDGLLTWPRRPVL